MTRFAPFGFDSGATFSLCRKYRYRLWRSWGDRENRCVFVGLNPSTADETKDDPTIRKCSGFAKRWGFTAIDMVNVFAWRSTDPKGLSVVAPEHIGPETDDVLAETFESARRIVWAWGQHDTRVRKLVQQRVTSDAWSRLLIHHARCEQGTFGLSQSGAPRHPLMLAYATPFVAAGSTP